MPKLSRFKCPICGAAPCPVVSHERQDSPGPFTLRLRKCANGHRFRTEERAIAYKRPTQTIAYKTKQLEPV